jgi:general L-amino acid transport system permease protein
MRGARHPERLRLPHQPAGFAIGESLIPFDSAESYGRPTLVGLSNTLRVALVGIVLATLLGTLVGIGRLSRNALVRGCATPMWRSRATCRCCCSCSCGTSVLTETAAARRRAAAPCRAGFSARTACSSRCRCGARHWGTPSAWLAAAPRAVLGLGTQGRALFETTGQALPVLLPGLLVVIGGASAGLAGGMPSEWTCPRRPRSTSSAAAR